MYALFLKGSVEVPLDSVPANSEVEKWLPLRLPGTSPRPPPKNANNKNDQLSIRVKMKYQVTACKHKLCYDGGRGGKGTIAPSNSK